MSESSKASGRRIPAPLVNPEAQAWFDGAAEGRLLLRHCHDCGHVQRYPRTVCPQCFSSHTGWKESAGMGTVYTYSVLRRGAPVPYCVAYVTLDEGVTVLTNLVDVDLDAVRIGMRVQVTFVETEGGARVAMFAPA